MQTTVILIGKDGRFPIWNKQEGLAKNDEIAIWLFKYCGWYCGQEFPQLLISEEEIPWKEGSEFFNHNPLHLYVLGERIIMN
ncbi:hypothetical protein [Flectobacillus sp. BAB-3569]|uniref:hypothetical protein n=1 Tax=Flectobacillus sp. BAB-3569 TaxID=1509483 RepID=UPI000BA40AE7|nr:hypothetical protein [Flectobacillus sp. BAB-3569]PAC27811.1 hypothetical protein BWI92_21605 [Flectobacillus sp. BAB-3569]